MTEHTKDSDCTVDPTTNLCTICQVEHLDPCLDCGQRAYHKSDCPQCGTDDTRVFACNTF